MRKLNIVVATALVKVTHRQTFMPLLLESLCSCLLSLLWSQNQHRTCPICYRACVYVSSWWWWWRGANMRTIAPSPPRLSSVTLWGEPALSSLSKLPCSIFHQSTWHHRAWSRFIYWPVSCHREWKFSSCSLLHHPQWAQSGHKRGS